MKKQNNKAFTLVELIVVITILAVLATVAFISFQGYTSSSRDSVRVADLKNISKSFEINRTKDIDFPLPDKKIDITASGTIFQYQWELSQNILEKNLNIFDGGLDPVTKKPYWYAVNTARNKFQIIWFLENSENVANISTTKIFADNSDKFVKASGDELWIILDETTNEIIVQSGSLNEIDIENLTSGYSIAINNTGIIKDTKAISAIWKKVKSESYTSCKDILDKNPDLINKDWYYTIQPEWETIFVYCDMTSNGWGWTIIWSDGLAQLEKSLYLETSIPSIDNKWLVKYFIDNTINDRFDTMRVVSINDQSIFYDYDISQEWVWDLILADSERGYIFWPSYYNGFSWWKNSPHKCNFSLVVVWNQWCATTQYTIGLPYNGKEENAWSTTLYPALGAVNYSWQFRTWDITSWEPMFRLWWIPPTKTAWNYYWARIPSYLMIR